MSGTILLHLVMNLLIFLFYHNAFIVVSCSHNGIKNRYMNLCFEDINYASVISVDLLKYNLLPTITIRMICVSEDEIVCSFFNYNKRKCILLPASKKLLTMLLECSRERSEAIRTLCETELGQNRKGN
jgi:hypothetical protein